LHHTIKPDGFGKNTRPAAECREAIPSQVDQVDVGSAKGDALLQDLRSLVHQRKNAPLDDLLVGEPARRYAYLLAVDRDQLLDHRIGNRIALSRLVAVPPGPSFLAESAQLADPVGDHGALHLRLLDVVTLADVPANIVARHIQHP